MQEATSSTVGLRQRLSRLVSEFSSAIQTSDESSGALIQIWMPEKTPDGKTVLRSSSLPFSVLGVGDLLALFRCVSVRYVFATDANQPHLMGAVGRVYASQQPEMSNDLQQSDKRLYLRATEAQRCRVNATLLVPIFDPALSRKPVAVFELSQNDKNCLFGDMINALDRCLYALHLHSHTALTSSGGLNITANPNSGRALPGSWHEPKILEGSPESSGESAVVHSSSNGFLLKELIPENSSRDNSNQALGSLAAAHATFDLTRRSMDGMRFQISVPPQPPPPSVNIAGIQQGQFAARGPATQPGLNSRPVMQGGLSASLASRDPNSNRKPQAAPPPSSIQIPINPPQMQARAGAQEAETSQQAKQLVEWMAANNVSTDALKTILLSKSPTDNNQSKKKRVHDAEGGISFQSLMTAQAAVDAGSGSLPKTLTALQGQKAGQDPIPNLPSLPQETMGQAMNSLAPQRQPQRVSRRSEGFELDELGSNDGDDGEEEDEDEDEKEGGGHRGSSYQGAKLTYEDLQGQFGKGIKDAAKDLGICTTTLKRACRRHGITRWPRRQIAKLNKALAQIGYAGDASGRLLESAVKGSKAGMSIKQASQPKPQFSTAVKQEDSFMPLSMKIPAANPSNVLPSDVLHSLLMIQAQRNQPGPAIAHPQSQPDLSHLLNQFSSSGGAGYSGQQQQYQQQQNQQQMWGHSAAPPNPPQMNYLPQHQSSEGRPQASADMLNLALELFSSGNGGEEEPDISLGSLLVNEEDMKGIGAFAGHATLF